MNYLELINKTLIELNCKEVNSFEDLTKNEHKRIQTALNRVLTEVCLGFDWGFAVRVKDLQTDEREIDISFVKRILKLYVNGEELKFTDDQELIISDTEGIKKYSIQNSNLLLPFCNERMQIKLIYSTMDFVKTEEGEDKSEMALPDDTPIIPSPYVEPIMVYGACMRIKSNPEHSKFKFWHAMYREALANLVKVSTEKQNKITMVAPYGKW